MDRGGERWFGKERMGDGFGWQIGCIKRGKKRIIKEMVNERIGKTKRAEARKGCIIDAEGGRGRDRGNNGGRNGGTCK
jgi:hypothetical protein